MWLKKDGLPFELSDRVADVKIANVKLVYSPEGHRASSLYIGGEADVDPAELQKRVLELALEHYGRMDGGGVVLAKPTDQVPVLTAEDGAQIPFAYMIGVAHSPGLVFCHARDARFLERVKSGVSEVEDFRFATFERVCQSAKGRAAEKEGYLCNEVTMGDFSPDHRERFVYQQTGQGIRPHKDDASPIL